LDLSNNTVLTVLTIHNNQLTSLDVSSNTALIEVFISNNLLTSFDVTNNTALTKLVSYANKLTSLDVTNNTALTELYVDGAELTTTGLDVSNNTALTKLYCGGSGLTSLDVTNNTALTHLECYYNKLTSLDVSKNTALTHLIISHNQLTSLDVSKNTALETLECRDNQLTTLDVTANTALISLFFFDNELTNLDISKNVALEILGGDRNKLTSLDVTNNIHITNLNCYGNQLTSLDLSQNTKLKVLYASENQLTSLNMRNGVKDSLTTFVIQSNPSLTCIEVLDPAWATANWVSVSGGNIEIDAGVTFSVICGGTAVTTWHVATTGSDASGSGTETSPLASIQTAINATTTGDTVSVATGTYVENINFSGKNIAVIGADRETTIIDGNQSGSVVTFENKETSSAILSGFTIQNGSASKGGGIFCDNSSPTLTNVTVSGNTATDGGGIYSANSSPTITSTEVTDNYGGWGGGFCILFGSALTGGNPTISNTLVAKNHGKYHGGGLYIDETKVSLTNVSITENTSNEMQGAGIHARNRSNIELVNVIHWNNEPSSIVFQEDGFKSEISISNSDIESGQSGVTTNSNADITWADGNIDADPMFADTANGDYHLKDWSPAIGAGTASGAPTTDIEGKPRPNPAGSNPDMGAYENEYGSPQNAPPVLSEIADVSVNEDESITVTLEAINADSADNDAITFSATSEKTEVKLSMGSVSGKVNISADENWNGLSKISVEATDGTAFDYGNFTVTFLPVNDKPVIASIASDTTNEETAKSIQVTASDIDGDELSISATTSNNHVVPSVSGMTLSLTPAKDFVGNALVTVIVSDGSLTDTVSYQFTVLNVNDSPVLSEIKDQRIAEDTDIMVKVVATDVDDTSLSFTGNAGSAGISAAFSGNDLTLKPEANWNGSSVITVYASDGKDMDSTKFNLTVDPMQDKPYNFNWVSTALDTINISQSNLSDTYDLKWNTSNEVDGEVVDYLIYAQIGRTQVEMVHDTTDTSYAITYQEFVVKAFEAFPMLSRATVKFSLEATDGIDTVKVTGDDRVVFVNRYDYLSTESEGIPTVFALHENYPNPFNPTTTLRFDLPDISDITLTIYNMLGQRVRTFNMNDTPAGYHSIKWNATNDYGDPVGAGVYLYQLRANQFVKTRKMVLLK
jgi:predicted outer membrane repeat protein